MTGSRHGPHQRRALGLTSSQATSTWEVAMRKNGLRSVLAVLFVVFALAVTAQPAAADDPGATYFPHDYDTVPNADIVTCYTPYRTGVLYQYGAWGYFVD